MYSYNGLSHRSETLRWGVIPSIRYLFQDRRQQGDKKLAAASGCINRYRSSNHVSRQKQCERSVTVKGAAVLGDTITLSKFEG